MYKNFLKSVLDRLLACLAFVVLSPILIIGIVLAIIDSHGNPFFVHQRPGFKGQPISVIKLQTMAPEFDKDGNIRPNLERISIIGNFLRKTSIDELPQLLNVMRGNLSLVGPRPLEMRYLPHYTLEQNRRHDVLPGITGLAQVSGRNKLTWDQKFELDIKYVETLSFWLDCRILAATVLQVFRNDDVNSGVNNTMDPFA